ncbi:MAG TPA: extracellular solute-binding protein [Candidatus Avipropionibacterium avicola]|uniref:Extracellular solute-binding protein n=1 Tax=Candidatus Avipropionibacterium avicola TaxID=2840701 RepID=A0A9D1GYA4_9ACTN|nr:extracellular solute-binding protein [Candidatus Avipropionibacterium avicola]
MTSSFTRRRMLTGVGALGTLAATGSLLSACAGDDTGATPPPSVDPDTPVTITFMHSMASGALKPALEAIVAAFTDENPHIKVELAEQPNYGQLRAQIEAQTAAGSPPTIAQVYGDWAATYADSGVLVNLDQYAAESDQWDKFFTGVQDDLKLTDGSIWMWPFNKSVMVQYYNTEMVPQAPTSWEEFATVAADVSDDKVVALSIDPGDASSPAGGTQLVEALAEAFGDGVFAADGSPTFDGEGTTQALQFLVDLKAKGALALGKDYPGQQALGSQTGAFDVSSVASYQYNLEAVGDAFEMGVAPMPTGPTKVGNIMAGTNVALFDNEDQNVVAAGWAFMQFLASAPQQAAWSAATGYLPVHSDALNEPAFTEYVADNAWVTEATEQLNESQALPPVPWAQECSGKLASAISEAVNGGDVAAALAKAQQAAVKVQQEHG